MTPPIRSSPKSGGPVDGRRRGRWMWSAVVQVDDGLYRASVPSAEQFALDADGVIPGGFAVPRNAGASTIEVRIGGDRVTF